MDKFAQVVGRLNLVAGFVVAPLTGIITLLVFYEVVCRYILNAATSWTAEVQNYLQIALVMLGGGYTLYHNGHVRVDVLYRHFSEKRKAWVDILTALMITLMAVPMVWFGGYLTWEAFETGQTSVSAAEIVLWPSMATVPLGATLIILQAWASAFMAMRYLATGRKEGD